MTENMLPLLNIIHVAKNLAGKAYVELVAAGKDTGLNHGRRPRVENRSSMHISQKHIIKPDYFSFWQWHACLLLYW